MTTSLPDTPDRAARGGPPVRIGEIVPLVLARMLSTIPDAAAATSQPASEQSALTPDAVLTYGDLPPTERPLQRLIHYGPAALTTEELLALTVNTARNWDPVGGAAKELLALAHGRIGKLMRLGSATVRSVRGIGPAREAQLHAAFELSRRCLDEPSEYRKRICAPADIVAIFAPGLWDLRVTEYRLIILNTQHDIAKTIVLARGRSLARAVDERTIFCEAIKEDAESFALVQNHPSGNPRPSSEEEAFTRQLAVIGREVAEIPLYDRVIIGHDRYFSFREQQWI